MLDLYQNFTSKIARIFPEPTLWILVGCGNRDNSPTASHPIWANFEYDSQDSIVEPFSGRTSLMYPLSMEVSVMSCVACDEILPFSKWRRIGYTHGHRQQRPWHHSEAGALGFWFRVRCFLPNTRKQPWKKKGEKMGWLIIWPMTICFCFPTFNPDVFQNVC